VPTFSADTLLATSAMLTAGSFNNESAFLAGVSLPSGADCGDRKVGDWVR
jgi:hypothetical protein